ncbi:hypothetical protein OsI_18704 [Oryza sativa Indica Group]|uniref:acyl-CoA oxidase n=2 Tax=Oryza sativa subsp. indica TaxID=39946 RepID=A2Y119_ORYSI|nr:hypothetical protein OsI_18704 [Oryza sativa Indica Group]
MATAASRSGRRGGDEEDDERTAAMRRLRVLSLQLQDPSPSSEAGLAPAACAAAGRRRATGGADAAAALAAYLRGRHRDTQARVFEFFLSRPDLQTPVEMSTAAHRELCFRQLCALVREAGVRPLSLMANDPAEYFAVMEAAGGADISLGVKLGVQYSLWGGSIINLGTKKHRDRFFDGIDNLDYPGCFAMTELHHGSNVQALQTTATFDPVTDEFIINTPNDGAIKWWIGNAALHGKFATVFARLILPLQGKGGDPADMGIHAFIVPIRDLDTNAVLPGIEINDCGHKIGLNGVDNGALRFRSVRIPRDNLLNRFGDVSRDGKYTSSLPTINKRFAATLGELVGGRVGIAYSSVGILKVSVTIAVRYALLRQQFGPPKKPEISVLDYQSHQHKLMPMLASSYAFHFATRYLVDKYSEMKKTNDEDVMADVHSKNPSGLGLWVPIAISSGNKTTRLGLRFTEAISRMIALQTLSGIGICKSSAGALADMHNLTKLKKLSIYNVKDFDSKNLSHELLSAIEYLTGCSLKSLAIDDGFTGFLNLMDSLSTPKYIHTLELSGELPRVPKWISELQNLEKLTLSLTSLSTDALFIIAQLPVLFSLAFSVSAASQDHGVMEILTKNTMNSGGKILIPSDGFHSLQLLRFSAPLLPLLSFLDGAMPKLQRLELRFRILEGAHGVENLASLQQVLLRVSQQAPETTKVQVSDIRSSVSLHPNRPTVVVDEYYG